MDFQELSDLRRRIEAMGGKHIETLLHFSADGHAGWVHQTRRDPDRPKGDGRGGFSLASSTTCLLSLAETHRWHPYAAEACKRNNSANWKKLDRKGRTDATNDLAGALAAKFIGELEGGQPSKPQALWSSAGLGRGNPFTVAHVVGALTALKDIGAKSPILDWAVVDRAISQGVKQLTEHLCLGFDRLEYLRRLGTNSEDAGEALKDVAMAVRRCRPGSISIQGYPPNAFLTFLAMQEVRAHSSTLAKAATECKGCHALRTTLDPSKEELENLKCIQDGRGIAGLVGEWAIGEMRRQLALHGHDDLDADVFQLGYAALAWNEATFDHEKREPEEVKLAELSIRTFLEAQTASGTWPRSNPLFHYPRVGNAHCYDYEFLAALLGLRSRQTFQDVLLDYLPAFRTTLSRIKRQMHQDGGTVGWPSGHHPRLEGPESWPTASVFHYLFNLDLLLGEAFRRVAYAELRIPYEPTPPVSLQDHEWRARWESSFWDCPLPSAESMGLREYLMEHIVGPLRNHIQRVASGMSIPDDAPVATAILYGPPGTSKTEVTKLLAETIGWRRLALDPSHFLRKGNDQLPAEVDRIFDILGEMEEVVVLVDEFDEMVRERGEADESLSRFLTTIMLPKLARISDRRRCVFLLATNHYETFDSAIRRPGRFDAAIPICPPSLAAKREFLDDKISRPEESAQKTRWRKLIEAVEDNEAEIPELQAVGANSGTAGITYSRAIGDLTYLEFHRLVDQVLSAGSESEILSYVKQAAEASVMLSNASASTTYVPWRDHLAELERRRRLPRKPRKHTLAAPQK